LSQERLETTASQSHKAFPLYVTVTIIWRAIKQAQIPALKEPVSLMLENNKRPDGTTLLPWARGKPLPWDVTVPNTFAESHISDAVSTPGAAANKATQHKLDKYAKLLDTRLLPSRR